MAGEDLELSITVDETAIRGTERAAAFLATAIANPPEAPAGTPVWWVSFALTRQVSVTVTLARELSGADAASATHLVRLAVGFVAAAGARIGLLPATELSRTVRAERSPVRLPSTARWCKDAEGSLVAELSAAGACWAQVALAGDRAKCAAVLVAAHDGLSDGTATAALGGELPIYAATFCGEA